MGKNVFIIGLGLIGGSLALCIKKDHPNIKIIGYDIHLDELKKAVKLGIVDDMVEDISDGARNADFILISAPVLETAKILAQLANIPLKDNVIISDTGSTKEEIVKVASSLRRKNISFIGGHPMAGSHKSGVLAAKSILFENAFYLLTPTVEISNEEIESLKSLLSGTKAKFLMMSAEEHDRLTGVISHFPHLIAASLVHQAEKSSHKQALVTRLAAGGFRDITRIASSSPNMWKDILLHNKAVLVDLLNDWKLEMEFVKELIVQEDSQSIFEYFHKAKQFRDLLPNKEKGAIPAFYDLFIDVPDFPGVVSEVTAYLAEESISITNIRIIETREEIYGILVISFQTDKDRSRAMECIKEKTNYFVSIDS